MSKQLMIKPDKCINCRTCELVCSFGHFQEFNPKLSCVTVLDYEEAAVTVPVMCMQCEEPACLKVCPVGAISRNENEAFVMDESKCIVCKMCMNACPLGNISFNSVKRKVFKCDLCEGDPKCAKFCPSGAIVYGTAVEMDRKRAIADQLKDVYGLEEQK